MPPFSFTCIACGGAMEVSKQYGRIQCLDCGRFLDGNLPADAPNGDAKATATVPTERWVLGGLMYQGETTPWMQTLIGSLRTQLHRGEREEAIKTCQRLLNMNSEFLDAHLWIARLSQDETEQRRHLDKLLAIQPHNLEVTRLLLVLNGEMTEEEARRSEDVYHDNRRAADGAVTAQTKALLCPICRGGLTVNPGGAVECAFCGYQDETSAHAVQPSKNTSLAVALIKQRGKAVRWQVGERMVHCNECGADRVLPPGKMSGRCPFCNSNHVIVQDTLGAFRQPDGVVRFRVRRKDAKQQLHAQLNSHMEKLKGFFSDNRVADMRTEGVFLPYWAFDVMGKAIITDYAQDKRSRTELPQRHEASHSMHSVLVPAVDSPPRRLLNKLGKFDLLEAIPYTPKLLSKFAAELYHYDFDQASLDVRTQFRREAIQRNPNRNPNMERTVATQVDHMTMRLMLLPVWVVTIREKDGDLRTALVNGQTGKVVLGQARKHVR